MSYSDSVQSGWVRMNSSALRRCRKASLYLPSWTLWGACQLFLLVLFNFAEVVSHAIISR
jgi:hypothetical protein